MDGRISTISSEHASFGVLGDHASMMRRLGSSRSANQVEIDARLLGVLDAK